MKRNICPLCNHVNPKEKLICEKCKYDLTKPLKKKIFLIVCAVIVFIIILSTIPIKTIFIKDDYQKGMAFYELANKNLNLLKYKKAKKYFNKADEYLDMPEINYSIAQIQYRFYNYDIVIKECDKALKIDYYHKESHFMKLEALELLERYDEALKHANTIIELFPKDSMILIKRASIYYKFEEYDSALIDIDKSIELNPNGIEAYSLKVMTLCEMGDIEKAHESADKVYRLNPTGYTGNFVRGYVYYKDQEYEKAESYLEKAYSLRSDNFTKKIYFNNKYKTDE